MTNVKVGDKVAVEAGVNCGQCRLCNMGKYNLCPSSEWLVPSPLRCVTAQAHSPLVLAVRYAASAKCVPHQQGTLQTYYNHPARLLHALPSNVTLEQGSLIEPLSVALHGARRAQITAGQSVLVLGGGAVGLLACEAAKALGASRVRVVDISQERVEFASREGFAEAGYVMPRKERLPQGSPESLKQAKETADEILAWAGEDLAEGFDVVMECTGVESCMQAAIHVARIGGKVVYIGMGTPEAYLWVSSLGAGCTARWPTANELRLRSPIAAACFREVDILGVFRFANTYPAALALLASGRLSNIHKLVTHRVPLERASGAGGAFDLVMKGKDDKGQMVLKVVSASAAARILLRADTRGCSSDGRRLLGGCV